MTQIKQTISFLGFISDSLIIQTRISRVFSVVATKLKINCQEWILIQTKLTTDHGFLLMGRMKKSGGCQLIHFVELHIVKISDESLMNQCIVSAKKTLNKKLLGNVYFTQTVYQTNYERIFLHRYNKNEFLIFNESTRRNQRK